MLRVISKFTIMLTLCAVLSTAFGMVLLAAETSEIRVFLNDQEVESQDPIIFEDGRLFVPIRLVVDSMGAELVWDEANKTVELITPLNDRITFSVDQQIMELNGTSYVMDVSPFIRDGRTYLPLRHTAEFMHTKVLWDESQMAAYFYETPLYTIASGDTVRTISAAYDTSAELLMERNGMEDGSLFAGDQLKVVIPSIMGEKVEHPDVMLLAKIIEAEAGYESFEGQVAVGNVILNRVEDSRFPDSIEEVVYQPGQFTPAMNGSLEDIEPSESSIEAAQKALEGENVAGDALYFMNPNVSSNSFFNSLETVTTIGNHRFSK